MQIKGLQKSFYEKGIRDAKNRAIGDVRSDVHSEQVR
jgi:hypothetical protein